MLRITAAIVLSLFSARTLPAGLDDAGAAKGYTGIRGHGDKVGTVTPSLTRALGAPWPCVPIDESARGDP